MRFPYYCGKCKKLWLIGPSLEPLPQKRGIGRCYCGEPFNIKLDGMIVIGGGQHVM